MYLCCYSTWVLSVLKVNRMPTLLLSPQQEILLRYHHPNHNPDLLNLLHEQLPQVRSADRKDIGVPSYHLHLQTLILLVLQERLQPLRKYNVSEAWVCVVLELLYYQSSNAFVCVVLFDTCCARCSGIRFSCEVSGGLAAVHFENNRSGWSNNCSSNNHDEALPLLLEIIQNLGGHLLVRWYPDSERPGLLWFDGRSATHLWNQRGHWTNRRGYWVPGSLHLEDLVLVHHLREMPFSDSMLFISILYGRYINLHNSWASESAESALKTSRGAKRRHYKEYIQLNDHPPHITERMWLRLFSCSLVSHGFSSSLLLGSNFLPLLLSLQVLVSADFRSIEP